MFEEEAVESLGNLWHPLSFGYKSRGTRTLPFSSLILSTSDSN